MDQLNGITREYLWSIYVYIFFIAVVVAVAIRWGEYESRTSPFGRVNPNKLFRYCVWKYWSRFKYQPAQNFYSSQWQTTDTITGGYIVYRAISCIFYVNLVIGTIVFPHVFTDHVLWTLDYQFVASLICLNLALNTYQSVYSFVKILTYEMYSGLVERRREASILQIFYGLLHYITTFLAFGITTYDVLKRNFTDDNQGPGKLLVNEVITMVTVFDLFIVRHNIYLIHIFWPCGFLLIHFGGFLICAALSEDTTPLMPFMPEIEFKSNYLVLLYFVFAILFSIITFALVTGIIHVRRFLAKCFGFHNLHLEYEGTRTNDDPECYPGDNDVEDAV